jgi:NADH-quinone oxidoreductase subunit L
MTNASMLLNAIVFPAAAAVIVLAAGRRRGARESLALLATLGNLILALKLFGGAATYSMPWAGLGLELNLRLYHFSGLVVLAAAVFGLAVTLYGLPFLANHRHAGQFYFYLLLTLACTNGVALADNLVLLLFFWEGLLVATYGMIAIGHPGAYKTAMKALVIVGVTDVCLMFGIALAGHLAGTMTMSKMHLPLNALGSLAFIFMMIGAISKGGSAPFHTWIPDAALDAPLPFMALLPAALEKLLSIYFLTRIALDLFAFTPESWLSPLLMIIGAATLLGAVLMALIQKDYKRLLSYHAISQLGYMILGIGTAVPAGIVGGIFHMLNNALYKSCLFLSGGAVEKQAGTTDLNRLGGLARRMPVTFACFFVTAIAISGVPPLNGFFSKELVYDGALERGWIYYAVAILGSFLTAASFLKLGHAAYGGKLSEANRQVKEAPLAMLAPMIVIAGICILFGVYNTLPLRYIQPILGAGLEGHDFSGWPHSALLVGITCAVLALAIANHIFGARRSGSGVGAADHIHHAPVLAWMYAKAERRLFDPYEIGIKLVRVMAWIAWAADRFVNWLSDGLAVGVTVGFSYLVRKSHTGNASTYMAWSLIGLVFVILFIVSRGWIY